MKFTRKLLSIIALGLQGSAFGQVRVDVVVYGGTPAGVMAATAAARGGATVALLEPGRHLGGMVSGGLGATDVGNATCIGGETRRFFNAIGTHYGLPSPGWKHEPHVAESLFAETLKAANVDVHFASRLRESAGVTLAGPHLSSLTTESGQTFSAKVFIDASYEGDLMAQAGVKYTVGREAVATYNEERAGIRPPVKFGRPGSARDAKGLIPDVIEPAGQVGDADDKIMSYTFRLCLSRDPANRVLFTKPADYDPRRYELVLLELAKKPDAEFGDYVRLNELPNGKIDANNRPGVIVSTNLPNGSWGWPDGTYADRERIFKEHESYLRGFYWFMQSDPRVSKKIRDEAREWGLAADEFKDTQNWPSQIYVRVARRMIGEHVMTADDLTNNPTKPDSVGMGSYQLDSHRVARLVMPDGDIATEGGVGGSTVPYEISYRSLTPKRDQCDNLLVPVCLSSSAVALCSIRMEPVYMILGESAGVAAALAAKGDLRVQDVPYADLKSKLHATGQVLTNHDRKANADAPPAPVVAPAAAEIKPAVDAKPAESVLPGIKVGPPESATAPGFFPAFDTYGQYVHRDWPGKIKSDADLKAAARKEQDDLQRHVGPADWDQYGGWAAGPKLEATGFFRTTKHEGRWWLVDPEGRLFFSIGMNCVRKMDPTPIEGRENFFANYPGTQSDFAPFVVKDVSAVKGVLAGKTPVSYVFAWSNLYRKHGADWDQKASAIAHQRLRSWGFNTLGNWSNESTYRMKKTPYVVNLKVIGKPLSLANGTVKDPYDPALKSAVVEALAKEAGLSNGDPWCLGYFVDNEIPWGVPTNVGASVLKSKPDQPAKRALVADLREKYSTIDGLNSTWRTEYKSWDELSNSVTVPEHAADDLAAFSLKLADTYYRVIKEGFVESGTRHLYLGSRIHSRQDAICAIAAKHCDVLSVNAYRKTVDLYADLDVPTMVTEFAFGATDRGMFYGGPQAVATQAQRVEAMNAFVESVTKRPDFVGYHWFQYQDQPASGRTREGENGAYGFVDIADNPMSEMIQATRQIASQVYRKRSAK